jgi:hypothetical protein
MEPLLLLPPFRRAGVAMHPPSPTSCRGGQARPDAPDRSPQACLLVQQVAAGPLPLILAGAGDGPCPPTGADRSELLLPSGPLRITMAEATALGQVATRQPAKVLPDLAQHSLISV